MPGPRFTDIRRFDAIDSTNRYLLEEARSGAAEGLVVVAGHQTAGRGRLGRQWQAPPGANLLVSILLRPELPADRRHLVTAAVALAAADAAADLTDLRLGVKWPNDLLAVDGRKVAGVLAEGDLTATPRLAGSAQTMRPAIVVGIGVNVNWPAADSDLPEELSGMAASLFQLSGHPVDPSELLLSLLKALEPRLDGLGTPSGRSLLTTELRDRCVTLGATVRIELADSTFEGRALEVTDEGHLLVETDGRTRTVVAGDVVHVRPQP